MKGILEMIESEPDNMKHLGSESVLDLFLTIK